MKRLMLPHLSTWTGHNDIAIRITVLFRKKLNKERGEMQERSDPRLFVCLFAHYTQRTCGLRADRQLPGEVLQGFCVERRI